MIHDRVRTGVARAKRDGTKTGRPIGRPKLPADKVAAVKSALATGVGILKVAKSLGLGTGTVNRIAAEMKL